MANLRVLIVDDEPIARRGVRSVVSEYPSADIVGECGNGRDAVVAIRELNPDIVFLDIRMPEKDGFEVIEEVGIDRMPVVIFATAFDEYAIRAFDAQAVDYVLKPFDPQRLRIAFERAETLVRDGRKSDLEGKLTNLLSEIVDRREAGRQKKGRLVIRDGGRILFVDLDELVWVESAGNYVKLHVEQKSYLQRETMRSMEERLPDTFVRISRSALVNLNMVKEFRLRTKGSYVVHLRDGGTLVSSRHYRQNIEEAASNV